ncbi:MAG TPA: RNA polymerase subunit sigma-70 [Lachnospiraceae bacterium]|nr:RNA polymerase subunit sigma-70 [Lachnospiraceae bacterium]
MLEDAEIVSLYFLRDQQAIRETDVKYGSRLMALSCRITQNLQDAEEIRNDTYLKAWNNIPPEKPESLGAYLLTICRNLSLNRLRDNSVKKRNAVIVELTEELERCIPGSPEPSGLEGAEIGKLLNVFLSDAAEEDRFLFVRRYFEMKSIREIAKEYGASENLVKVRLHRLRKKLKRYLEKEGVEL